MAADTRDRILDALEKLILDTGLADVTLEGVAAEAGVSKGGLLYHYPSKEALLIGLVHRLGDRADAQVADAAAGGTSLTEWYLQMPDTSTAEELALYRSTIAALRSVDGKRDDVQRAVTEVMRAWDEGLRAEIADPIQAEIVRLVGDGIYLAALLDLPLPDPQMYDKVVARLLES